MRAAVALTLLLAACTGSKHAAPTSGPPATEPPQVLAQSRVRHDFTPSPPTTVPTTTTTQPVTTTAAPVVPMTAAAPAPYGRLGDPYYEPTWYALRECEAPDWAGGWQANTGNGYYGGLQFALTSWQSVGGSGYPHEASVAEQIHRGQLLWEKQGWGAWPACSRKLGWR